MGPALGVPDSVKSEMGPENSYLSQIAKGFATAGLGGYHTAGALS